MNQLHEKVADRDVLKMSDEEVSELTTGMERDNVLDTVERFMKLGLPEMRYGLRPEPEFSVVPPGHYFCLGDNSGESLDGRVYGWVPEENLFGRAAGVWWPIAHRRDFTGFTHTWWGKLLIFGIPAAFVLYELIARFRERRKKNVV
jgi:hypothetical protein